jgi:fatty-acyl-CoA synthase
LAGEEELTEEDVISYCKSKLAGYKKPTQVLFRESLPRNQAGKIQKSILKDLALTVTGG